MSDRRDEEPEQEPVVIQPEPEEEGEDDEEYRDGNEGYGYGVDGQGGVPAADEPYDSRHFHIVTHKLMINAVFETLSDAKMDWDLIQPFLESAREMAQADFDEAELRLHTVRAEGDQWVEAEEAYLGISVADRDSGEEWLNETRWLSDLAIAEDDSEQVRRIIAALERSIAKMRTWIAEKEAGGAAEAAPPANDSGG
jgi:hypothetical protein